MRAFQNVFVLFMFLYMHDIVSSTHDNEVFVQYQVECGRAMLLLQCVPQCHMVNWQREKVICDLVKPFQCQHPNCQGLDTIECLHGRCREKSRCWWRLRWYCACAEHDIPLTQHTVEPVEEISFPGFMERRIQPGFGGSPIICSREIFAEDRSAFCPLLIMLGQDRYTTGELEMCPPGTWVNSYRLKVNN